MKRTKQTARAFERATLQAREAIAKRHVKGYGHSGATYDRVIGARVADTCWRIESTDGHTALLSTRRPKADSKPCPIGVPDTATAITIHATPDLLSAGKRVALLAEPMPDRGRLSRKSKDATLEKLMMICGSDRLWFYAGAQSDEWCAREWTPVTGARLSPAHVYTLQAGYAVDGLKLAHDGGRIYLSADDPNAPVLFASPCGEWAYLVMPIRSNGDDAARAVGRIAAHVDSFRMDDEIIAA